MISATLSDKRWRLFLALVLVGLVQSFCFLGLVYAAKGFVETQLYVLSPGQALVVIGLILVLASGRFFERFVAEKFAQDYVVQLRERIYAFTLSLPAGDRDLINRGATLLRLTSDMSAIRNWIVQGVAPLTVLSVWLLIAVWGLVQIHWLLGLVLIPCLVATIAGNYVLGSYLYRSSERARKSRGRLIRNATEKLRQFYLIKTFNQQGKERRQFNKKSKRLLKHQISKAKMSASLRAFNEAALLGSLFSLFFCALLLKAQGLIAVQSIAILLTAGLYMLSQMRRLSRLYELWTLRKVALDKLSVFFSRTREEADGRQVLPSRSLKIKLRKLSVDNRFAPFSAVLRSSSRVVLVGRQGAGKSSLLMALAGLLPIDGGKLIFNGRDSERFHPSLWGKTVALISQDLPLLRGSIRFNLFYGARRENPEYTEKVLKLAEISEKSLDSTYITEAGGGVSEGYIFRLKLARALLRRPKVLLIDNESGLRGEENISIMMRLFIEFKGAIVMASEVPDLSGFITARWNLEQNAVDKQVPSARYNNVVCFEPPLLRGEG